MYSLFTSPKVEEKSLRAQHLSTKSLTSSNSRPSVARTQSQSRPVRRSEVQRQHNDHGRERERERYIYIYIYIYTYDCSVQCRIYV